MSESICFYLVSVLDLLVLGLVLIFVDEFENLLDRCFQMCMGVEELVHPEDDIDV